MNLQVQPLDDPMLAVVEDFEAVAARAARQAETTGCAPATPIAASGCASASSELMTTAEVADLLDCSTQNVRARAARGSLVGRNLGSRVGWVFTQAAVEDYIAHRMETT